MDRIWAERMLRRLAAFGRSGRRCSRAAYSNADWEMKMLLAAEMKEMGMRVFFDAAGNLIGRLEGSDPGASALVIGGYTDTVSTWGNYDSSAGVISALGTVRRVMAKGMPKNPLEVWIFAGHEASSYGFAHLGSRWLCGLLEVENQPDFLGIERIAPAAVLRLQKHEYDGAVVRRHAVPDVKAYFEFHIEREPIWPEDEFEIGIVTDLVTPVQLSIQVMEESGAPLKRRHDALAAAAGIVFSLGRRASYEGKGGRGRLAIRPVRMNTMPGQAEVWLEIRAGKLWLASAAVDEITREVKCRAREKGVGIAIETVFPLHSIHLADKLIHKAGCLCESQNIPSYFTIANHCDAQEIARRFPSAVLRFPWRGNAEQPQASAAMLDDLMKSMDFFAGFVEEI